MTPTQLANLATGIYGKYWQSPLARDLGVALKTVHRWAGGEFKIPEHVRDDLKRIVRDRMSRLQEVGAKL